MLGPFAPVHVYDLARRIRKASVPVRIVPDRIPDFGLNQQGHGTSHSPEIALCASYE